MGWVSPTEHFAFVSSSVKKVIEDKEKRIAILCIFRNVCVVEVKGIYIQLFLDETERWYGSAANPSKYR